MQIKEEKFICRGYEATVLIPENPNGEWLWKTEFFYAFDKAERELCANGYVRAYFSISDKYGSPSAVALMREFYGEILKRYNFLSKKCHIIGFSRGGLYAFNFALAYPDAVKSLYLDAPVLDLRTWPRVEPEYCESALHAQVLAEYGFSGEGEFENYGAYPVGRLKEFFAKKIPTLLIAGANDKTVDFAKNSALLIDYCVKNGAKLTYYVKADCDHHPHSLGNEGTDYRGVAYAKKFAAYSSEKPLSSPDNLYELSSDCAPILDFYAKILNG